MFGLCSGVQLFDYKVVVKCLWRMHGFVQLFVVTTDTVCSCCGYCSLSSAACLYLSYCGQLKLMNYLIK